MQFLRSEILAIGTKLLTPDGFDDDGNARPWRVATIAEFYGPNNWPRVRFENDTLPGLVTITTRQAQEYRVAWLSSQGLARTL